MGARLPLGTIQEYLATLHQVRLSTGALADLLERCGHATAPERALLLERCGHATAPERALLLAQARASPVAHMDETGCRGITRPIGRRCRPSSAGRRPM